MNPKQTIPVPRQHTGAQVPVLALARELGRLIGQQVAQAHAAGENPLQRRRSNVVEPDKVGSNMETSTSMPT